MDLSQDLGVATSDGYYCVRLQVLPLTLRYIFLLSGKLLSLSNLVDHSIVVGIGWTGVP